jgi:heme/copper-type cytochrome/quinol oxidase subunit 3
MSITRSAAIGAAAVAAMLVASASPALAQTTTTTNDGGLNMGVVLVAGIVFAVACGFVAKNKNRSVALWAVLGFLFGFIPLIIIAVLKKKEPETGYGMASGTYSSTPPPPPPPPPA